ncbi:hypothetical protein V6N13_103231 [Hibiscus sabdariffa]
MDAIISIVGALVSKAVEYTVDPTARQLGYLFKARSKFQNLRTKVRDLEEARQRLQQSVEAATRNGESLCLERMGDVEELQMLERPNVQSFQQLRFIKVNNCNMINTLFSISIAKRLCQLEILEVSNCKNITKLLEENEEIGESDILKFNKLRILKLIQLERLSNLWYSKDTSQYSVGLFDKKISCPVLEELKVNKCPKLKYVFTSSMVKFFVHLKKLQVFYCDEMDGVIEGTLAATEGEISSIIRHLKILGCHALNTFTSDDGKSRVMPPHYLFDEKVILPALEKLDIRGMDNLERLWADQLAQHSFSKLTFIFLNCCPKLLNVLTWSMLTRLVQLKHMVIHNCENIKEIIQGGDDDDEISFPQLNRLELVSLPELESFCSSDKYTFRFPSLKFLVVEDCPKMKMFSQGQLNTPMLRKVRLNKRGSEKRWKGNLNSTIQMKRAQERMKQQAD